MKRQMLTLISMIIIVTLAYASTVYGQEKKVELTSLGLASGEAPLSSGPFFEANFSAGEDIINLSLGEKDMYLIYLKSLGKNYFIGPSVEYYYNIPTLGIMGTATPITIKDFSISTMTWSGISAGDPGMKVELLNWRFLFFWQSVDLNYKNLTVTGAILYFDGWGPLVDAKYCQPINKNWKLVGSAGYSFYKEGKALLKMGIVFTPGRN